MTNSSHSSIVWLRTLLILLLVEKIIQHGFVTLAFYFNWNDIGATVAVEPKVLMVLGGLAAILFAVSLWGLLTGKPWVRVLVICLALFDMIGEFVAQATMYLALNVSFIVATLLLLLMLGYRPEEGRI